ncbi:MAG TPA: hypothetical protein VJT08_01075 [Terriglobales bacterium]|nr:hypothetical protein [Terriglobales bacterium]
MSRTAKEVTASIVLGAFVGAVATVVHLFLIPEDAGIKTNIIIGDFVGALISVGICAVLQLRASRARFLNAVSGIGIVCEFGHQICTAVLPLCSAVQTLGDEHAIKVANHAIQRIIQVVNRATRASSSHS